MHTMKLHMYIDISSKYHSSAVTDLFLTIEIDELLVGGIIALVGCLFCGLLSSRDFNIYLYQSSIITDDGIINM